MCGKSCLCLIWCDNSVISSSGNHQKGGSGIFHSSHSDAVWNLVGGHVVVGQVLPLVPRLDGAGDLRQLLPELLHGVLDWLLYEVLFRIHTQVELQEARERTRHIFSSLQLPIREKKKSFYDNSKMCFRTVIPKANHLVDVERTGYVEDTLSKQIANIWKCFYRLLTK